MQTFTQQKQLSDALRADRKQGKTITFVPTMGNLHDGHLALVKHAKTLGDKVVVSIFVNPMQFDQAEDLERYPRTLAEDSEKLLAEGTDYLFTPSVEEMYPNGMASQTTVTVPDLSESHCGASRPGHFTGMATVVTKLLQLVHPDIAVFGEKDFQQLAIIRKMVSDLCMPMVIEGAPTVRAKDGLALSSRNGRLTETEREIAPLLYKTLQDCRQAVEAGNDFSALENGAKQTLEDAGFKPDYFAICDAATLQPAKSNDKYIVILAAAFLGNVRLIDNISFTID